MKRLAVKEVFRTVQGEGAWAGRPAVFVRFVGCNMWSGYERDRERDYARTGAACCRWCDTSFTKEGAVRLSAADLADEVLAVAGPIRFVVLTGGEPLLQADAALVGTLRQRGFFVAVETNGTIALADAFVDPVSGGLVAPDWVVCSPKLPEGRLRLEVLDELKLVVPAYRPADYAAFARRVRPHVLSGAETRYLWVQPEDGPRLGEATRLAVDLALAEPAWRVSVQGHKVLGVD